MSVHRVGRRWARLIAAAVLAVAVLLVSTPAQGHDGDESDRAFDLVRQAIALIVNTPNDHDAIADKVNDALDAKDTDNVQLPLVQQAKTALDADDMHQVRTLLEQSIGARVHTGAVDPVAIGNPPPATGADTGTLAAVDAIPGRHGLNGGDWVLLIISVVVGLAGMALAFRLRPQLSAHPSQSEPAR